MNWGLELGPKTDGFMALARSSPSVDFVCHRVRIERKSQKERDRRKRREGKAQRGAEEAKIKVLHSNL